LVVEASEVTYTEARRSAKRGEPVNRPQSSVAGVVGMGIDGVSIGSNDLTQLMLGVDRDSDVCAELFDEADPAVLEAVAQIIEKANLLGDYLLTVRSGAVDQPSLRRTSSPAGNDRFRLIPMRLARRDTPSAQPNDGYWWMQLGGRSRPRSGRAQPGTAALFAAF
jgi:hypothetical protein